MKDSLRPACLLVLLFCAVATAPAQTRGQGRGVSDRQQAIKPSASAYNASHFDELVSDVCAGANSQERAQAITQQLAKLKVPYESQAFEFKGKTGTNILATLPAPKPGAPVIMLGAHYDRVAQGQGAVDNAAGVAAALELLATFRRVPLKKYQVVAAFWDLEEKGLAGSQAFLSSAPRDKIPSVYINFDMLGYGDTLCAAWKDENSKSARAFRAATVDRFPLFTGVTFPPSDDRPFAAAGVEVVAIALSSKQDIESGLKMIGGDTSSVPRILQIMHTPNDTPEKVSGEDNSKVLPVIERAIRLIAVER